MKEDKSFMATNSYVMKAIFKDLKNLKMKARMTKGYTFKGEVL